MRFSDPPGQAVGLLPLQLVIALVLLMQSSQEPFVYGIAGTTAAMQGMGIPLPHVSAIFVTAVELLAGDSLPRRASSSNSRSSRAL